ncbi:unnamed protein product [Adineta ricciae]|uniref:Uncharacterized protein n=1 Tax=Adineta ricciae TaxID=249248 RepID=A0A815FCK2_ADIRI|nr:unnamed protein product [Adineta ricciae]CAF1327357.1 unnamed protein product [Adineta ricciae]
MSRLVNCDHLLPYICQLKSIVLSLLCDHTRMKCVDSSIAFQYISCPVRFIEELQLQHPCHSLVIQTLHTFHTKYDGCSCKTLLFFLTAFFNHLQPVFDGNNQLISKRIFNHLDKLISQSISVAKTQFTENLLLTPQIISRICRHQTIYSESLYQAYVHLLSKNQSISQTDLITYFDNLHHLTRVKHINEKCLFMPGTLLQINKPIDGYRRTVCIDGHILEDYAHLGYNNKLKLKQISSTSSWLHLILSILKQYSIESIICSGTIDQKLKDIESNDRIFIENIPVKTLRFIGQNSLISYLTDVDHEHILSLNYMSCPDDASLTMIDKGATIVQYVPLDSLIDVKHEQFLHCLSRFRQILRRSFYLNGSGQFEDQLCKYWYDRQENSSQENHLAHECFLECLQQYIKEITNRRDCFQSDMIDDFDSKFDAWRTSLELVNVLTQIDHVVEIVTDDQSSDI